MFKVLDQDGNKITVEKVDITKHKHLSWREFTKEEFPSPVTKKPVAKETTKPLASKKPKTWPLKKS